jgi:hypothetical protein
MSEGFEADPADQTIVQMVFCEETNQSDEVNEDILNAMKTQICRFKAELAKAFAQIDAELAEKEGRRNTVGNRDSAKSKGSSKKLDSKRHSSGSARVWKRIPYERWLKVLEEKLPEYSVLWRQYASKLQATSSDGGDEPVPGDPIAYLQWLDRFQVTLDYDKFASFEHAVLSDLYRKLHARTNLSMAEVLSYFDPDNDGVVRLQELHSALRKLDLGLSRSQLNQLVLSLGYTLGDEEVEPVEIIRGLLAAVAPATKKGSLSYSGEMPLAKGESATPISAATTKRNTSPGVGDGDSSYTLARRASAVLDMKVKRLRDLIMRHKADVTRSFGADGIKELFQKADRGDVGFLTYDDCDVLIKQLQAA